jgi:hypothetical protein
MGISELLAVPVLSERYRKLKQHFYLRESAYDVTSACQLRCDGCYYFEGEKYKVKDNRDPEAWRAFFRQEQARGINYVILAGAEPALVPKVLQACYDVIPNGSVASNGLKPINRELRYRVHLSVWGDGTGDPKYRQYANGKPGPYCLLTQLENYKDDDRVIFAYTFNSDNANQVDEVLRRVHGEGHQITFNVFSVPQMSRSSLKLRDNLQQIRDKMFRAIQDYPDNVIYSYYNAIVHTSERSLHELFSCPYPRAQRAVGVKGHGIGETFRSHRTDFSHVSDSDCCVPDIDCLDCRHYAAGSAIVSSRLNLHVDSEYMFRGWLDYVDTYLAVWVLGYKKGANLFHYQGQEPAPYLDTLLGTRAVTARKRLPVT